jgi:GTP pyrophosphokinase
VILKKCFGQKVKSIIDGLTKISGEFDFTSSSQAENFKKMFLTIPDDVRVILIKLADRLHNMRTLDSMKESKEAQNCIRNILFICSSCSQTRFFFY